MFDFLREKRTGKWLAKIILALLIIPFALWGVDSYRQAAQETFVAKVGDATVSEQEFENALRERQDRMRTLLGRNFDPAVMESPELRQAVVEDLVNQRLLLAGAARAGVTVTDAQLAAVVREIEQFQVDGRFSRERYELVLRNRGMTLLAFEARLRQDLAVQQLRDSIAQGAPLPSAVVAQIVALSEEQREVALLQLAPEQFLAQAKVEPAVARAYYDANRAEFEVPEQVRLEYLVLSPDVLAAQVPVEAAEAKKYFEEHAAEFGQPEERRASHILVSLPAGAGEPEQRAARSRAEELAKQARQAPGKFADLARQHSQDPGSAASGGDLGFFARGSMVKAFEDAVFAMKPDEIRGPVQSDFGFHIIRLTAVKPGKGASFEESRAKIEQELRKQKATRKFAEVADGFGNLVYEQSDSLKPAADAFKLQPKQTGWVARRGGQAAFPVNDRMLAAVFSDETLKSKRNTEAIEVAPNTLVSARVLEYRPAALRPFEEASAEIVKKLQRKQAADLAVKQGQALLEKLAQGQDAGLSWPAAQRVSRQQPQGLVEPLLRQVLRAPAAKLPAYVGAENPKGGYTLAKITRVVEAPPADAGRRRAYGEQLRQLRGQEELAAYLATARARTEVKLRPEAIQKKAER